jgi:2-haloacid dehalogenase
VAQPSAVIFDVGNVLFQWDRKAIYGRLIEDDRALAAFLNDVVSLEWHAQHDAGVSFAETSAALTERFPQHAALIAEYGPRFNDSLQHEVPGVVAILRALHEAGVPLFAITNFHDGFFEAFRATRPDVFDLFGDIVVSGVEKLIKPGAAIYHLALDRFGLEPGQAAFIDDSLPNIEAADALGIHGLLFTDAATLRADLIRLGFPL